MFKGSIVALITPFTEGGEIDFLAFKELVDWHAEEGTSGIVCCGTTGEAPTLSEEEQQTLFKTAIDVAKGRIPIIAGTGTYSTRKTVERTEKAKQLGADGCLVVVPYYNRPTPEGCVAHYAEVSKVGLPTIIYHHPGRTGIRLSAETLAEIAKLPSMVAIKEASGTLELIEEIRALSNIPILSGDDTLAYEHMRRGAVGVISIVANVIPQGWSEFANHCLRGDFVKAKELDTLYAPLYKSLVLETNPQCVKYAVSLLNKCQPHLRLPLLEPREKTKKEIFQTISIEVKS